MDLNKQKEALTKLRSETKVLLDTAYGRETSETASEDSPVESSIPTHEADAASITFDRERDEAFITEYAALIAEIDVAIEKLQNGTYGKCEKCGKKIPESRLSAQPYARLCIQDQEIDEGH